MAVMTFIMTSIGAGMVSLLTAPILVLRIRRFVIRERNNNGPHDHAVPYTCEDGAASEESEARYRTAVKRRMVSVIISVLLGFLVALTNAVIYSLCSSNVDVPFGTLEAWMRALCWILILLLAICVKFIRMPINIYRGSICGAVALFIITLLSLAYTLALGIYDRNVIVSHSLHSSRVLRGLQLAFGFIECVTGIIAVLSFLSVPRRPEIFTEKGRVIDREHTVSALNHYTLRWCVPLLDLAASKKPIDLLDLPGPTYATRARTVHQAFLSSDRDGQLWKRILFTHLPSFILQWFLTLLQSVMQFVPQLSMYNLLRQLELRQAGDRSTSSLVLWCITLGLSLLLNEWVQSWLYWIVFAQLATPIRAQLSALIFGKALRKKNIKTPIKGKTETRTSDPHSNGEAGASTSASKTVDNTVDNEEAAKASSQAIINLVGVDATRVADFCSMNCFLVNSVFKAIISISFLIYLIGWRALLAGVVSFGLVTPLTTYLTKRYSIAQKGLLAVRDEKLGVITEALHGIRQIKFAALEEAWEEKIGAMRERELGVLWLSLVTAALLEFVGLLGPLLLSSVSLTVYVWLHRQLTPSVAFTTLAVFSSLEATVGLIPLLITEFIDAKVSTSRIHEYLESPEKKYSISQGEDISFRDVCLAWPSDDVDRSEDVGRRFTLQVLNAVLPHGELTVVSGKTGSGKSLLLASLIGESEILAGMVQMPKAWQGSIRPNQEAIAETWIMPGKVAFVPQNPWVESMSIKENILFSLPMDRNRYKMTLRACSLEHDLELLPDGDETEVGANGINLSGGQRWRVALARALYSRADILVLDDVFSAVDAHVGAWILENALTGPLANGRTRILATHHVSLVAPKAKYTIVLADGVVIATGPVADDLIELGERSTSFENSTQTSAVKIIGQSVEIPNGLSSSKQVKARAFVQEERQRSGAVSPQIFWYYFKASGGLSGWSLCLLVFLAARLMMLGRSWWVKVWTSSNSTDSIMSSNSITSRHNNFFTNQASMTLNTNEVGEMIDGHPLRYYLLIYFAISATACLANTFKELYISALVIQGSKNLFRAMTYKVLRMPLRWIDTVPVGRILNRFTADFNAVDSRMAHDLGSMVSSAVQVLVIVMAGLLVSPLVAVLGIVLLGLAVRIARQYLAAAREVKRLDSVAKSPVFEQFGSALVGMSTIRAFDYAQVYMERMYGLIDDYTTTSWNLWLMNRWLSFNMGLIGVIATVAVSVIIVSTESIDAALAGFALSFTLEFSSAINWTLRRYANTELIMNAVERIHEYSELPPEVDTGVDVPAAWPNEGRLIVRDLVAGYDAHLPPVLNGVSFEVAANQRIGIVGRTGAGKSSLMLMLFRFMEARSGSIIIDDIDISKIKLHDLRSRLSIIPQDPGLFAGTIRSNLDPFSQHDDVRLFEALRRAHLTQMLTPSTDRQIERLYEGNVTNTNAFEDLSSPVGEGGLNLSQGQRQLLCLARALLFQPKILVLDEATSAVDMQTDALIQRTLREEFTNTTLIVIAHRLSTVADFDKILVMSNGAVEEFDSPQELMAQKGTYWRMVQESGERGTSSTGWLSR